MKRRQAILDLVTARAELSNLIEDKTGVTSVDCWALNASIDKTPELTPEVKEQVLKHLNLFIGSWVMPCIDSALENIK